MTNTQQQLWSPVPESLDFLAHGSDGEVEHPSQPEISDFDVAVLVHENVLRLQVSVQDSEFVEVVQACQNLIKNRLRLKIEIPSPSLYSF